MFTQKRAVDNFVSEALNFSLGPIALVASAAVCYIAGAAAEEKPDAITKSLKAAIEEQGLKAAQMYRYTGLGRKLADAVRGDAKAAAAVEAERSPTLAQTAILDWLDKTKDVRSVDALSREFGIYQRTAPGASAAAGKAKRTPASKITAAASKKTAAVVEEVGGDPIKIIGEMLHIFRLNHDKDSLLRVQNIVADEIMSLERSAKRAVKIKSKSDNGQRATA